MVSVYSFFVRTICTITPVKVYDGGCKPKAAAAGLSPPRKGGSRGKLPTVGAPAKSEGWRSTHHPGPRLVFIFMEDRNV